MARIRSHHGGEVIDDPQPERRAEVTAAEFGALFRAVSRWGRWGEGDERGALHFLTPASVRDATRLVVDGITVTLSLPLDTEAGEHNPMPADHHMTMFRPPLGDHGVRFLKDFVGVDYHNDGHTHIDALCHVAYKGTLYNERPASAVTATGASCNTIEVLRNGLIGRGVLLDIPRLRGVPWLEPGEHIWRDELEEAEREQGVRVGEGDILLIRTGHAGRLAELGPWNTAEHKAGLHPTAMPLIAERGVAVLGSDGNNDTAPSSTEGVDFPIHVLAITAMGVHLLDYLQLEECSANCERTGRWEFLFAAAPLRIIGGTGSPLNPVAVF
jgi:kynurenine formamidase